MPGPICCLLGACCPPGEQRQALKEVMLAAGMEDAHASAAAEALADPLRAAAAEIKPKVKRKK